MRLFLPGLSAGLTKPAFPAVLLGVLAFGCGSDEPPPAAKAAPATVQQPRTEAELTTVTLSPEAVQRLGVETAEARVEKVSEVRTLGGEIVVPEGRAIAVTVPAPLSR